MSAPAAPDAAHPGGMTVGTEPAAVESAKDEPAPAPSATVPPKPGKTETEPSATDSDT